MEKKDSPPKFDWITRLEDGQIQVNHKELPGGQGVFTFRKPTFGVRNEFHQFKGSLLSVSDLSDSHEFLAEWQACVEVGTRPTRNSEGKLRHNRPEDLVIADLISVDLVKGIYFEVQRYWKGFQ